MKILFIILIIFLYNICISQQSKSDKVKSQSFLVIKITTIGNEDNFYNSILILYNVTKKIKQDTIRLINSNTYIKRIDKKDLIYDYSNGFLRIIVRTDSNEYIIFEDLMKNIFRWFDTLSYVLDYNKLDFKEKELIKDTEHKENENKLKEIEQSKDIIISEAQNKKEHYENMISGQSHNSIADFLYQEGFSRNFSNSGSIFKEIFEKTFYDENNSFYRITIEMWYSYGYGNLYYDVYYSYYINDNYFRRN